MAHRSREETTSLDFGDPRDGIQIDRWRAVAMTARSEKSRDQDGAIPLPPIVLLVEDDLDALQAHSLHLESVGLWVATATSPADGFTQVRELQPNLLVTDLTFAGQPAGADLVHAVKKDVRTSHIPVLVLSATARENLPSDTLRQVDAVLVKPVMPSELYSRGKALIRASKELRARSVAALKRAESLSEQNVVARQRGREFVDQLQRRSRACPKCGTELEWLERGTIRGAEYDYYRWCLNGCGLYCFDRRAKDWIRLAG
jgi:DNA-binding response OmpR family regulator